MKIDINTNIHNRYDFRLIHADGTEEHQTAYNVVTNNYYNRIRTGSEIGFQELTLGTGTGTVSVTDTALFNELYYKGIGWNITNIRYISPGEYVETAVVTFTEDEAVGNLTEIGIKGNYNILYSHALITDSEGQPIAINKSNTDRLIITITIYLTIQLPSNVIPDNGIAAMKFSNTGDQLYTSAVRNDNNAIVSVVRYLSGTTNEPIGWVNQLGFVLTPGGVTGCYASGSASPASKEADLTPITDGFRLTMRSRVLAADWNLPYTYQIYAISTWFGYIPITSNIFPPAELTLTAAGDGTVRGFNFNVGELMANPKVYIDDILQSSDTYTWNGIDYVNTFQTWETARAEYTTICPVILDWGSWYENRGTVLFNTIRNHQFNGARYNTDTLEYDFQETKTFTRAFKPTANQAWSDWEYSTDGTNWTTITIPSSGDRFYDFPTPITARYLRTLHAFTYNGWDEAGYPQNHSQLCCYKDQLVFNTAPPAGSVIKIEARTAYPIKNSNWLIDQLVIDVTVSRGT